MKNSKLIIAIAFGLVAQKSVAQVEFKIQRLEGTATYVVSAVPQADYASPKNIVGSAQVTIKVPSGGFEIAEIQNLHNTGRWRINGRCSAPQEEKTCDYIYFGLENLGSRAFGFKKGVETILFAFKAKGQCTGEVSLMDNRADAFRSPNSMHVNVGNQMSILGAGGDAYAGNRDGGKATCFDDGIPDQAADQIVIYPNPVSDKTFQFALNNKNAETTEGSVWLYDMAGRAIYFKKYPFTPGLSQQEISLAEFPVGVYQMVVFGLSPQPMRQTVVKGDY